MLVLHVIAVPLPHHCCTGGALGTATYWANLRELGNGVALWLGISPPDLFFYAVGRVCQVLRHSTHLLRPQHTAVEWGEVSHSAECVQLSSRLCC